MSTNHVLQWCQMHCKGEVPTGRVGESLTTSENQQAVFLYGGMVESDDGRCSYLDDFFAFDPILAKWQKQALISNSSQPEFQARAFHSTVIHEGRLYIFGGCGETEPQNDVVSIDPSTGKRELVAAGNASPDAPAPRYCHSAVVFEDAMYVFGGKYGARTSNARLADIFKFDFATRKWSAIEQRGEVPPSRSAHSAVVCGRRMYVFGGRAADRNCCGEMYEYSFDTSVWRVVGGQASAALERARHSAVLHNGVIAVFGGWNGKRKLNDLYLHALDGSQPDVETEDATVPARRDCHTAVMWRNTMLVFSGRCRVSALNDVQALRLGPPSLLDQCRDWLVRFQIPIDRAVLPQRLAMRIKAWEDIHSVNLVE